MNKTCISITNSVAKAAATEVRRCDAHIVLSDVVVRKEPAGTVFLSKDLTVLYAVVVNTSGLYILSYNVVAPSDWHLHERLPLDIPEGAVVRLVSNVWSPTPWFTAIGGYLEYVDDSGNSYMYDYGTEIVHPRAFRPAYSGLVVIDGTSEFDYLYIGPF